MSFKVLACFATIAVSAHVAGAATVDLDGLQTTDRLGYGCVQEADLESAFALGGKGSRLPPICVVDPCADVTKDMFDALYGHQKSSLEYDAFLRRQDGQCGGPVRARFTDEQLLKFGFNGSRIPPQLPPTQPVPLDASGGYLLAAAAFLALFAARKNLSYSTIAARRVSHHPGTRS